MEHELTNKTDLYLHKHVRNSTVTTWNTKDQKHNTQKWKRKNNFITRELYHSMHYQVNYCMHFQKSTYLYLKLNNTHTLKLKKYSTISLSGLWPCLNINDTAGKYVK